MTDRLTDLLLAWEEDDAPESQLAELTDLLERDPICRQRAVAHFDLTAALAEHLQEAIYTESVVDELQAMAREDHVRANRRGRNLLVWAAALAMLVSATATAYFFELPLLLPRFSEPIAELSPSTEANDGSEPLLLTSLGKIRGGDGQYLQPLDHGVRLRRGATVETDSEAYATLHYDDGTTLEMSPHTRLHFASTGSGKQLSLERGALFATVARQPAEAPMIVNPGRRDQVTVVGTRFELRREETGEAIVRVASGKIKFGSDAKPVVIAERQESRVGPTSAAPATPQAVAESVIWHGWRHGLTGEYYEGEKLRGVPLTRIDPRVDFDWGEGSPDPSITGRFSVRWTGEIEPPHTGDFVFTTVAYYGVRLWVDGQLLIDSTASMGSRESTRPLRLVAGQRYPIRVDYFDKQNGARIQLLWSSDKLPQTVVDRRWLYPAAANDVELSQP